MEERDFKGIRIPKEVYLDKRLNANEKILLAEIDSLDWDEHCFAWDDYFSEFMNCGRNYIQKILGHLKELWYVKVISFDWRRRVLTTSLKKEDSWCVKYYTPEVKEKKSISKEEYNEEFELFREAYPKKVGKAKAKERFIQAIKKWNSPQLIIEKAKEYKLQCQKNNTEDRYIKRPEGWLNSERYLDWETKLIITKENVWVIIQDKTKYSKDARYIYNEIKDDDEKLNKFVSDINKWRYKL